MSKTTLTICLLVLLTITLFSTCGSGTAGSKQFTGNQIHIENNVSDKSVNIVIRAKTKNAGLKEFILSGPSGTTVDESSRLSEAPALNMKEILIESPESKDLGVIFSTYAEGEYEFEGIDADGNKFLSSSFLSHEVPDAPEVSFSKAKFSSGLYLVEVNWTLSSKVKSIIVELKDGDTGLTINEVVLPGISE